jgi:RNA polymerase sigma-70 factor (ECF subfamily)
MDTPSTPPLEELLTHARWARALARQLLRDEQRADDVVQEAWLAAVERPPRPGPGLRAWFARLVRNLASNQRRAELRRARHERDAAAPELAPPSEAAPPAPILDEFAAQQLVAQALLALDEPYRETLLRRWYRDEKPAAIARAMQVPVKTVDTRLARGLEKLRAELTARRGGTSREWCLMLAPLAQAGAATGVVAAWTGGALTTAGLAKLAAAVTVAAAAVAGWQAIETRRAGGPGDSKGRPVASARNENPTGAPAVAASAGAAASRTPDPATPSTDPEDPLAAVRGPWHLHGRVVDETSRLPIEGVEVVAANGNGRHVSGPTLAEVKSDANGEFTLERLSRWTSLSLKAPGRIPRFEEFKEADLADDRDAAPREFTLESRTYGTLVCRLHARDRRPIPASVDADLIVTYAPPDPIPPYIDHFEGLPQPIPNGPSVVMMIPVERHDDVFEIERAPARVAIRVAAFVDGFPLGSLRVEPLAPGERREIDFAIDVGIVVRLQFIDAATGDRVSAVERGGNPMATLRWTGARPRDHLELAISPGEVDGTVVLPGPGRVAITGTLGGFAPIDFASDVVDGAQLAVPLTRWRRLFVKVRDARGDPWKMRFGRPEPDTTTRSRGFGFLASGRAPSCVVVAAGEPLPSELDPDAPVAAKLNCWCERAAITGFRGFAPSEPLRVGIYDDGRLVGSTDVPATAPLLADERSTPPSGRVGEVIPDPPARKTGESFDAPQTVTVDVALPPPSDGALRFQVVDREDGRPVAAYEVWFEPLVLDDLAADGGEENVKVTDPVEGLFSLRAIPAGDWRMRICRGQNRVADWIGRVSIDAGRTTDLGTLTVGIPGRLAVRVVDEDGARAIDAEIRVATADGARPLEFWDDLRGSNRQTSVRTNSRPRDIGLELAAGKVRVEARSAGYAPAFADVDVPPNGNATCTITLKILEPDAPPADATKR